jgi:Cof subfamily protein (haloacid dehalogenase superfamily)
MADAPIKLMLADVDGTLVTNDKVLTDRAIGAVGKLRDAGITFAVTSGRPPRGMAMLVEPLALDTPLAAFNGGLFVHPDMTVIESRTIPQDLVEPIIGLIDSFGLDAWVYRGADWFVLDLNGAHVDREQWTVKFPPTLTASFADLTDGVAKIVGVSDDLDAVAKAETNARDQFGDHVSAARSQPYYLDVTHPQANKGGVVAYLSKHDDIAPEQIATIGDMPNDVLMFTPSGLSIAMGNASAEVQAAADHVTTSNQDEGFAEAVERFVFSH